MTLNLKLTLILTLKFKIGVVRADICEMNWILHYSKSVGLLLFTLYNYLLMIALVSINVRNTLPVITKNESGRCSHHEAIDVLLHLVLNECTFNDTPAPKLHKLLGVRPWYVNERFNKTH